jgi:hypothetical protein
MSLAEFDYESVKLVVVLDARGYVIVCKCMECELLDFDVARVFMNELMTRCQPS